MPKAKQKQNPKHQLTAKDYIKLFVAFSFMGLLTFVVFKVAFIPKDAATDTQVWETLTEHGFTPTDRTTLYRDERPNMMITKNITYSEKSGDDYTLWFEFFVFEDAQHAMNGYDFLTTELSQIERNYTNDNIDVGGYRANFVYRTLKAGGKYYYLMRIDNTLLYAYGDEANMDVINQIASELGYVGD